MKKKTIITLAFVAVLAIVTILATTYGNQIDWPDSVHVDYGFPFVWATNTLSTIAGAVNIWAVDIAALTMNLALWLAITVIGSAALMLIIKEKN